MSKEYKTTEFSAHLSRSRMRKYLHDQLKPQEMAEVETHLKHCAHCSEAMISYIQTDEPENYKLLIKKLKGKLTESVKPKEPRFSAAQIKIFRAAAAVTVLFLFSFFAFDKLIDKDFNLVSKFEKEGNEQTRRSVFKEDKPQTPAKVSTKDQNEAKTSEPDSADDQQEEMEQESMVAENREIKKEEKKEILPVSTTQTAKVVQKKPENQPVPQTATVAEAQEEEVEDVAEEAPVQKASPVAQVEKEEAEVVKPEPVAPIQKIEKVNSTEDQEQKSATERGQKLPSATIGQLPLK